MKDYFWRATIVCGTLDIGYAAILIVARGGTVGGMLRTIATGPFGKAASGWGMAGAAIGLAVHYAIMAAMVAFYALVVRRGVAAKAGSWWLAGAIYGAILYLVMYWIVLPLRWPAVHPNLDPATIAAALFAHVVLVGLPMAFIARRTLAGAG